MFPLALIMKVSDLLIGSLFVLYFKAPGAHNARDDSSTLIFQVCRRFWQKGIARLEQVIVLVVIAYKFNAWLPIHWRISWFLLLVCCSFFFNLWGRTAYQRRLNFAVSARIKSLDCQRSHRLLATVWSIYEGFASLSRAFNRQPLPLLTRNMTLLSAQGLSAIFPHFAYPDVLIRRGWD